MEGTVFEEMRAELPGAAWSDDGRRTASVPHPTGDGKQREVADMVVVQMREEHRGDFRRAHVGAHHVADNARPAIEKVMTPVIECHQHAGLRAVRIDERCTGSEHCDLQSELLSCALDRFRLRPRKISRTLMRCLISYRHENHAAA